MFRARVLQEFVSLHCEMPAIPVRVPDRTLTCYKTMNYVINKALGIIAFFLFPVAVRAVMLQTDSTRTNLIFILTDQWRGQALGFLGIEPVLTPYLDSLAKESLVLTRTIANYPLCSPSRASLLTGNYPIKTNVYSNVNSRSTPYGVELSQYAATWSDALHANGYSNGYIGKWHLDSPQAPYVPTDNNKGDVKWNEWTPPHKRHGNDFWYAYGTYDAHLRPMYWSTGASRDSFRFVDQWGPEHEVDKAISYLKNEGGGYRDNKRPFSLFLSVNPPHSPYDQVPEKYVRRFSHLDPEKLAAALPGVPAADTEEGKLFRESIRQYYAALFGIDEQVGRLLKVVNELGLSKNTIIVFTSDHGNCLGRNMEVSKNSHHEESLRVPFMIHWKDHIKARIDSALLFSLVDVCPTLLSLMNIRPLKPTDGKSRAAYFLGNGGVVADVQYFMGRIAPDNRNTGFRGVRNETYKLVYDKKGGKENVYLFNYLKDPYDQHNLASSEPGTVKSLTRMLQQWLADSGDPYVID